MAERSVRRVVIESIDEERRSKAGAEQAGDSYMSIFWPDLSDALTEIRYPNTWIKLGTQSGLGMAVMIARRVGFVGDAWQAGDSRKCSKGSRDEIVLRLKS